jgi:hypothetical protein
MKILEMVKTETGAKVKITFEMKDSLKSAIPSAKWLSQEKMWSVGVRCVKKLENWIENASEQFDADSIQKDLDMKQEKIKNSYFLKGHTFDFKDEMKDMFSSAFFAERDGKKGWFVSSEEADEAQKWLDSKNESRKSAQDNVFEAEKKLEEIKHVRNVEKMSNLADEILKLIEKKEYKVFDKQIGKNLDGTKKSPSVFIKSEKTDFQFNVTHFVDIEKRSVSRRVHKYFLKNIPVMLDKNYTTVIEYWHNTDRKYSCDIENEVIDFKNV